MIIVVSRNEGGWLLQGADPSYRTRTQLPGMVAHDLLDHGQHDDGSWRCELMALGSALFGERIDFVHAYGLVRDDFLARGKLTPLPAMPPLLPLPLATSQRLRIASVPPDECAWIAAGFWRSQSTWRTPQAYEAAWDVVLDAVENLSEGTHIINLESTCGSKQKPGERHEEAL